MKLLQDVSSVRNFTQKQTAKQEIGLVPTMGALHRGHRALLEASLQNNDLTICSIYVNPTQFNNPDDLDKYPRTLEHDLKFLEEVGCDAVFCPPNQVMYPKKEQQLLQLSFGHLDKILEGQHRPGHFSGVGLVVSKLLNIVQPRRAYFGQKDLQQLAIIRQMVREFCISVEIMSVPIVREASGLALSSRNQRLSSEEKQVATQLYRTLLFAQQQYEIGIDLTTIKQQVLDRLSRDTGIRVEYFEVVRIDDFHLIEEADKSGAIAFCVAAYVGDVRLIDNIIVPPAKSTQQEH
ncbi:pantoate--beta-alanine ligase [Tunicatimonas pelagia]|uniref:pantoate--beta-alanine ligase n=1 Tax=Tunicatimonas pelagia TaxID=931531 RepID=UPI002666EB9C|nr:pantoate--beta-alanine ligase [Tunicatimonas pelagia]WKN45929.1 pantoate--beta-alanine ligase [Tunicatimonas pelagia]